MTKSDKKRKRDGERKENNCFTASERTVYKEGDKREDWEKLAEEQMKLPTSVEEFEKWTVNEIRAKTCNYQAIYEAVLKITSTLYKWGSTLQNKGEAYYNAVPVVCQTNTLVDSIFHQLMWTIDHPKPRGHHMEMKFNREWKHPLGIPIQNYKLGHIMDNMIELATNAKSGNTVLKGEILLKLIQEMRIEMNLLYRLPKKAMEAKSIVECKVIKARLEKEGKSIIESFMNDVEAEGVSLNGIVADIDRRAENAKCNPNGQIQIEIHLENQMGLTLDEETKQTVSEKLEAFMHIINNGTVSDDPKVKEMIEALQKIQSIEDVKTKNDAYRKYIQDCIKNDEVKRKEVPLDANTRVELIAIFRKAMEMANTVADSTDIQERLQNIKMNSELTQRFENRIPTPSQVEGLSCKCSRIPTTLDNSILDRDDLWEREGKFKLYLTMFFPFNFGDDNNVKVRSIRLYRLDRRQIKAEVKYLLAKIEEVGGRIIAELKRSSELGESQPCKCESIDELIKLAADVVRLLMDIEMGLQFGLRECEYDEELVEKTNSVVDCQVVILELTHISKKVYQNFYQSEILEILDVETKNDLEIICRILLENGFSSQTKKISRYITAISFTHQAVEVKTFKVVKDAQMKQVTIEARSDKEPESKKEAEPEDKLNNPPPVGGTKSSKKDLAKYSQEIDTLLAEKLIDQREADMVPSPEAESEYNRFDNKQVCLRNIHEGYYENQDMLVEMLVKYSEDCQSITAEVLEKLLKSDVNHIIYIPPGMFRDYPPFFVKVCSEFSRIEFHNLQREKTTWMEDAENNRKDVAKSMGFNDVHSVLCSLGTYYRKTEITPMQNRREFEAIPDLDKMEEPSVFLVLVETEEADKGISLYDFKTKMVLTSYGAMLGDEERMKNQDWFDRAKARYVGQVSALNSSLCQYRRPDSDIKETKYSCGKGCNSNDRDCLSRDMLHHKEEARKCSLEWSFRSYCDVTVEKIGALFENHQSYNGGRAIVEQLTVENPETKVKHQVIRINRSFTKVNETNVKKVIEKFELIQVIPEFVPTNNYPERFGNADTEYKDRAVWAYRVGLLHVPRYIGVLAYLATHATVDVGVGDLRTVSPRHKTINVCQYCKKVFMSPLSLLFHLLYEEKVLGDLNGEYGDHSSCGDYTLCRCRLKKTARITSDLGVEDGERIFELFSNIESDENGIRKFETDSWIQLCALSVIDISSLPIADLLNNALLANQMGMHIKMPGRNFGRKFRIALAEAWTEINAWGNLYKHNMRRKSPTQDYMLLTTLSVGRCASSRLTYQGEAFEISPQELATQFIEVSQNTSHISTRMGLPGCEGLTGKYNPKDPKCEKIMSLKDRSREELEELWKFVSQHEELIVENIIQFCLPTTKDEDLTEFEKDRKVEVARVMMQIFSDQGWLKGKRVRGLVKVPIGREGAGRSVFDVCFGVLTAANKELAQGEITIDLNKLEGGKEMFPNVELCYKLSETVQEEDAKSISEYLGATLKTIFTQGWAKTEEMKRKEQGKDNPKGGEKVKIKQTFVPAVTKEDLKEKINTDRQKDRERAEIDKQENFESQKTKWRCINCKRAGYLLTNHKGGCYKYIRSGKEEKRANSEIKAICEKYKMERILKETKNIVKEEIEAKEDVKKKPKKNKKKAKVVEVRTTEPIKEEVKPEFTFVPMESITTPYRIVVAEHPKNPEDDHLKEAKENNFREIIKKVEQEIEDAENELSEGELPSLLDQEIEDDSTPVMQFSNMVSSVQFGPRESPSQVLANEIIVELENYMKNHEIVKLERPMCYWEGVSVKSGLETIHEIDNNNDKGDEDETVEDEDEAWCAGEFTNDGEYNPCSNINCKACKFSK